ncbi:MAG: serine acetyltransferase [Nitrospira sp.]|nr:serine acetyltransferase [Nitrospira sp.]
MLSAVTFHRAASYFSRRHVPLLPQLIDYMIRFIFACWLPHTSTLGQRVVIGYGGLGGVIHGDAVIGNDVHIDQCVSIGGNVTELGVPTIGNGVYIGAGAKILGPVVIGSHTVIGANAVVITDLPSNSVAVGVPARVIRHDIDPTSFLYHLSSSSKQTT